MKTLKVLLITIIISLQWELWFSDKSIPSTLKIIKKTEMARIENELSRGTNSNIQVLNQEMKKKDLWTLEDLARRKLQMIKNNETFFRITH